MVLNSIKTLQPIPRKEKEDATQWIVARTISFVENNLTSLDSLKEIANSLHISLSYLEATFRKNMGISLMQYIIPFI
jgi:methylphosphotriester-DNA--protein-cysteine methyltransferase